MNSETTAVVAAIAAGLAALVALVSSVLGPLVAYRIARRQIMASTIAVNRQRWIDALREDIVDFVVHIKIICSARDPRAMGVLNYGEPLQIMERLLRLRNRIALRLNPNEEDHKKLLNYIDAYQLEVTDPASPITLKDTAKATQLILETAQGILKREWQRVKAGE
jgi:hypothetical protein